MLSPSLLQLLRAYWREERPQAWLFCGQNPVNHLTARQFNRGFHTAADLAEIGKKVSPHTLRHSFATHPLDRVTNIRVIQSLRRPPLEVASIAQPIWCKRSSPHSGRTGIPRSPRNPSLEAFERRPNPQADDSGRGGIRNPSYLLPRPDRPHQFWIRAYGGNSDRL